MCRESRYKNILSGGEVHFACVFPENADDWQAVACEQPGSNSRHFSTLKPCQETKGSMCEPKFVDSWCVINHTRMAEFTTICKAGGSTNKVVKGRTGFSENEATTLACYV